MARKAVNIDIGINVPASEINKAERQINSLFNSTQSFNKNPINSKAFTQPLGRITGAANEFNKSLEASNARVIAFGASAGAIFAVQRALEALVKTTITVEQKLTNIQALLGTTGKEFQRLSDGLYKAAQTTGMTFDQTAESMEEFARQGLSTAKSLERTTAAMTLAKLGGMDVKNATESLTAAMNTFGDTAGSVTQVVNKLAQVDAKFAVSSGDLAEAIKRSGSAAVSANVSFEEFISTITVAQERTARGGAVIGNSFKTIFTRIQRPETLRQLKDLGVQIKDNNQQMLPAMTILKNYAKVYDSLAPSLRATSAEMLAGVFQVNVLKSVLPELANETGKYEQALKVANQTTNEATERMKFLTSTTEGTLNKTLVNLTKFASEVGNLTIKPALDRMLSLLNGFAELISPRDFLGLGETVGTAVYKGMGKIIEGPGLVLLGVVLAKIGAKLAGFVRDISSGFIGIQSSSEKLANTQNIITNILAERPKLIQQATASEEGMVAVARVLAQKIKESRREMELLTSAAQKAAPAVLAMQGGAKATGGKGKGGKKAAGFVPTFNITPSQMAAGGFVPNYDEGAMERRLAEAGGYQAGKIKQATIPGVGQVTFNGNEKIKNMPGLEQPAIMPPSLSSAGRNYRDAFQKMHGYDPYNSASGFIPNFNFINPRNPSQTIDARTFGRRMNLDKSHPNHITAEDAKAANYVPSKTTQWNKKGGKKGTADRRRESGGDSVITHAYDAAGRVGILSMFGGKVGGVAEQRQAYLNVSEIPAMRELIKKAPELANDRVLFDGVQVAGVQRLADRADDREGKNFSKFIGESMAEPLAGLASEFGKTYLGNELSSLSRKKLADTLRKAGSYLNPGTEGDLFELAVRALVTKSSELKNSFDTNRSFKQPFDFEEVGMASPNLVKLWGFEPSLIKADGKRSATQDQINSVVKKSYNQAILHEEDLGAMFSQNLPGLGSKNTMRGGYLSPTQRQRSREKLEKSLASGFVPNFAAAGSRQGAQQAAARVGAISNAITREDRAGVRRDKIRVGMDKRLRGGIGVYNTDEGSLANAINMHLASGANMKSIQTMGKAFGYIPNFAKRKSAKAEGEGGMEGLFAAGAGMMLGGQIAGFGDELEKSKDGVVSFTGSIMKGAGELTMWVPTLQMVLQSMGGMSNVVDKVKGGLNVLTGGLKSIGSSIKGGVTGAPGGVRDFFTTDRLGAGTSATRVGGGRRRRSLAQMIAGRTAGGNERQGFGGSIGDALGDRFSGIRSGYRRERKAGRNPFMAGIRGGGRAFMGTGVGKAATGLGSTLSGGALGGGAAAGLGVAAGAGVAVIGAVKAYQYFTEKARIKEMDKIDEAAKKNIRSFEELGKTLGDLKGLTDQYAEAVDKGDQAEQNRLRSEMEKKVAIAGEGGALQQFFKGGNDITLGSGKRIGSAQQMQSAIIDPNTNIADMKLMTDALDKFNTKMGEQNATVKDLASGYSSYINKQNKGIGAIIGVGASEDMTGDEMTSMAEKYASLLNGLDPASAAAMLQSFKGLAKNAGNLDKEISISEGQMKGLTGGFKGLLKGINLSDENLALLSGMMDQSTNTLGANEADFNKLKMVVLARMIKRLNTLSNTTKGTNKSAANTTKKFKNLFEEVTSFNRVLQDSKNKFALKKGLDEIFEKETLGMFDIVKKSVNQVMTQTASKLSGIQVSNEIERQRIDMIAAQTAAKRTRDSAENIFKVIEQIVPNVAKKSQSMIGGFTGDMFAAQVGDKGALGEALMKAAQSGDMKAVDAAIAKAITNTTAGGAFAKGGAKESETITANMIKLGESVKQQIKQQEIQKTLDKAQTESQKALIDAQEKAAIAQMELSQRISFMGGLQGGSGSPEKFARDFQTASLTRQMGNYTGSADLKTQGMINMAKTLNSLRLGGSDFTDKLMAPMRDQIANNIVSGLRSIGIAGEGLTAQNSEIQQIAKDQIDNLIKPDKTITDVANILTSKEGFGTLNQLTTSDGLKVLINNWHESPEEKRRAAVAEEEKRKKAAETTRHRQALTTAENSVGKVITNVAGPGTPVHGSNPAGNPKPGIAFNLESQSVQTGLEQFKDQKIRELHQIAQQRGLRPKGINANRDADFTDYLDVGGQGMRELKMVFDREMALQKQLQKRGKGLQGMVNRSNEATDVAYDRGPDGKLTRKAGATDAQVAEADKLAQAVNAEVVALDALRKTSINVAKAKIQEQRAIEDHIAATMKAERDRLKAEAARKAAQDKALKDAARKQVTGGVQNLIPKLTDPTSLGPIAQELQAIRITRGSGGTAGDGSGVKIENNNIARQAARDFYNKNKDIPNFFQDFEGDIERLGETFEDTAAAKGFEAALKEFQDGLMDLQQRVDWKGLSSGMRTVEQATQNTRDQIRVRVAEGKSIKSLLANLKQLQKEREKNTKATGAETDALSFFDAATEASMSLNTEMRQLGLTEQQAAAATKEVDNLIQEKITNENTHADKLEKLRRIQEKYNNILNKTREAMGLLTREEVKQGMVDAFTNQTQRTAQEVKGALNNMIDIISGADYYSTAESSAMRAKQINSKLANDLIKELDSEVSAIEGKRQSNARQRIRSGEDPKTVMDDLNTAFNENAFILFGATTGLYSLNDALYMMSRNAEEADLKLQNLNRRTAMLGSYDPSEVEEANVRGARRKAMESGVNPFQFNASREGLLNSLSFGANPEDRTRRQNEAGGMVNAGIFDAIGEMSSQMTSGNIQQAVEAYRNGLNGQQQMLDLDEKRIELMEQLKNSSINMAQAELGLAQARAKLSIETLRKQYAEGTIKQAEFQSGIASAIETLEKGGQAGANFSTTLKADLDALFLMEPGENWKRIRSGITDIFSTLKEGVKGALKEVIMGTASMREAFQKVFASIADKMLDNTLDILVDQLFNIGYMFARGYNKGGVVGYNGGGVVRGGSGVRDDVPALLTKGEYVVRKSAVGKYGSGFLEKINKGEIRQYQDGGSASFNLANQFDYNDPKRPTAGTMNVDSRMSAFAQTDTNNPMNQLKFDREQTLDNYLKEKAQYEEQKRQAMAAYKKQRKGIIKQAVISIAMAGITHELGEYLDEKIMTPSTGSLGLQTPHPDPKMAGYDIDGNLMGGDTVGHFGGGDPEFNNWLKSQGINPYSDQTSKVLRASSSFSPRTGGPRNRTGLYFGSRRVARQKNQGGIMRGAGLGGSDNIPALLTGGEYVVNKRSVDHYGLKFMEDLNKGRLPGFNRGGLVGEGGNGTPTATGTGGAPSNVNNNITINVTVEKDGNVSTDTSNEQAGGNQNTQGALQEEERNKQFSGAIKDAVVREIVEQKRPGGLLYNEQRTGS